MRYDSPMYRVCIDLRMGVMVFTNWFRGDMASERLTHLDPALIGKAIHRCARPKPGFEYEEPLPEGVDWQEHNRMNTARFRASLAERMELLGIPGVEPGGPANIRTTAMMILHSDGKEAHLVQLQEPCTNPYDLSYVRLDSHLSLRPLYPLEDDREGQGRKVGDNNPLLIAPWHDVEMLGHAVLLLFGFSGPPLNKGATSVFSPLEPKRRNALHRAARDGLAENLPPRGRKTNRNLNPLDVSGMTPLMLAAANGHAEVAVHLLELGADPHLRDHDGRSALHSAAEGGHEAVVRTLLEADVDSGDADAKSDTALYLAAAGGHTAVVERLLSAGADPDATDSAFSATPLHKAARAGRSEVVALLVDAGADVDAPNEVGRTPLHTAVSYGHTETARAMLACGADVNRRDHQDETPMHRPAFYGHLDCMELLIENGADVNARTDDGSAPLHVAASMNRHLAIRLLLDAGADVEAADQESLTPLDLAIINQHLEFNRRGASLQNSEAAEVLLNYGASIDAMRIPIGDRHVLWPHLTPPELLFPNGDIDYSKLEDMPRELRERFSVPDGGGGRAISEVMIYKPTLLHDALIKGKRGLVELLLGAGADPMTAARLRKRGSPLHVAAAAGEIEMANMLIDTGRADLEGPASGYTEHVHPEGRRHESKYPRKYARYNIFERGTALDYAIAQGQEAMVRFLLERGAELPLSVEEVDAERERRLDDYLKRRRDDQGAFSAPTCLHALRLCSPGKIEAVIGALVEFGFPAPGRPVQQVPVSPNL